MILGRSGQANRAVAEHKLNQVGILFFVLNQKTLPASAVDTSVCVSAAAYSLNDSVCLPPRVAAAEAAVVAAVTIAAAAAAAASSSSVVVVVLVVFVVLVTN